MRSISVGLSPSSSCRRSCASQSAYGSGTPRRARIAISRASIRAASARALVIEALQVQHAVDHQMGVVRGQRFSLLIRFLPHDRRTQHDVAGAR